MNSKEIEEKLIKIFKEILKTKSEEIINISQDNSKNWDSVNHMHLIMDIESKFNISLDEKDVVQIKDYNSCTKIIRKKINA
tara:strand:- start:324 stop:566 length:243 start_codon:yes stop_codon:yes gene_type:complete